MNPLTDYVEDPIAGEPPPAADRDPSTIDQAHTWMCYMSFGGDIEKTAISSKVPTATVLSLEHDFNWPLKLKRLKTGAGAAEAEKIANRVVNYLQAQMMRNIVQRSISIVSDEEELMKLVVKYGYAEEGQLVAVSTTPKAVLDLCKALESVQNASYRALGDKVPTQAETMKASGAQGGPNHISTVRDVLDTMAKLSAAKDVPEPIPVEPVIETDASTPSS